MNEFLFVFHAFSLSAFVLLAFRLGKEALIVLMAIQAVLANLFVLKQISLFGFQVTCSDAFAVGSVFALNLLREFYGKEVADRSIQISFLLLLFYLLMAQIHLGYIPSSLDTTQGAFQHILQASFRIVFASVAVFYAVQRIDLWLFQFLQKRWEGRKFVLRMALSGVFSQFLDTVLFTFLGLYGLVDSVFDVILLSFCVKCLVLLCSSPFLVLAKRLQTVSP